MCDERRKEHGAESSVPITETKTLADLEKDCVHLGVDIPRCWHLLWHCLFRHQCILVAARVDVPKGSRKVFSLFDTLSICASD